MEYLMRTVNSHAPHKDFSNLMAPSSRQRGSLMVNLFSSCLTRDFWNSHHRIALDASLTYLATFVVIANNHVYYYVKMG